MVNRKRISKLLLFACLLFSCERTPAAGEEEAKEKITSSVNMAAICDPESYDLDCIKSDNTSLSDEFLTVFGDVRNQVVDAAGDDVSDERQDQYGDEMRGELEKEFPILENHPRTNQLQGLMKKLLRVRKNPSEINYHIFVAHADQPNAFTLGGEIFVTDKLLDESESLDELACIIGHEIGHNELGHIARKIKEQELAQGIFGEETGAMIANMAAFVTMGFNQINEAESDIYGIDLAISSGYDPCRGIDFWKRIQQMESTENELDNLVRSHPYSSRRIKCYQEHLASHHKLNCP